MRKIKFLSILLACLFLILTSCQKEVQEEQSITPTQLSIKQKNVNKSTFQLSAKAKADLEKLRSTLPEGYEKRLEKSSLLPANIHSHYRNMALKALKIVEPTPCDGYTPLYQYLDQELADWWEGDTYFWAAILGMLDMPTVHALFFENSSANQYFGVNGEYTHIVNKTFKDLQRFWNIQSNDIVLVALHGNILLDREKVYRLERLMYPWETEEEANFWVDQIVTRANTVAQYRKGNHPIFSFNAFAQTSFEFPPYGTLPSKIVMGDGIMEAYSSIGYGNIAPQAILAHEFGHQVQFSLGLIPEYWTPEGTRKIELMADAYSAYFLSHARGASMQWKRVQQFLQVFFNIGDCYFDFENHHGTPTQRMAAAEWAYNLANNAQKQGHILSVQEFAKLFEEQLPLLVKF